MRRRLAATLLVAAALLVVAMPAAGGGAVACAAATAPHAALVVDTGSRSTAYCVALDAPTVTGIHLIQLAGAQHGLTYGLGFGGQAVCRLQGVGPAGDDCFADYPRFWGYWHGDGHGGQAGQPGWIWASTGAASATVGSGDVEGWVWGTGDSPATHPMPPRVGIDAICAPAAEPSAPPSAPPSVGAPPVTPSRPASSAGASASPRPRTGTATPTPGDPSGSQVVQIVAAGPPKTPPSNGGVPPGVPIAAALAIVFVGAGLVRARGRKDVER